MLRRPSPTAVGRPLAALVALVVLVGLLPHQAEARSAEAPVLPCSEAATRTQVTASLDLDPTCTYVAGFDITASDVTLDCRGATVRSTEGAGGVGILVRTPIDVELHDVTIRNCHVIGFLNSIRVTRDGFRTLEAGHEFDHPIRDVLIEANELERSRGVGVYVDGYVSGVTISGNDIHDAGSTGVYLETGSKQTQVLDNEIVHDGYNETGPDGDTYDFAGTTFWFWGTGREGIAVDASFENTIRGNHIANNSAGGIFLYKNCGEYKASRPGAWLERRYPAANNLIEGNRFDGSRTGVWVGSRMGENTLTMECGDPAYVDTPTRRVVLDRADHNTIRANEFHDVTYGVRVEDDHTTVADNTFTASSPDHHAVVIGTPDRTTVLDRPVVGTVLTGNRSTIIGNASPYRWVFGERQTTDRANVALGQATRVCEGRPIPRQTFIFVVALVVAPPDGSKPATPDLTIPEVGSLPACRRDAPSTTTTTPGTTTTGVAVATETGAPTGTPTAPAAAPITSTVDYTG